MFKLRAGAFLVVEPDDVDVEPIESGGGAGEEPLGLGFPREVTRDNFGAPPLFGVGFPAWPFKTGLLGGGVAMTDGDGSYAPSRGTADEEEAVDKLGRAGAGRKFHPPSFGFPGWSL